MLKTSLPKVPILRFDLLGNIRVIDPNDNKIGHGICIVHKDQFDFVRKGSIKNAESFAFIRSGSRRPVNLHSVGEFVLHIPRNYAFSVCAQTHSDMHGVPPNRLYVPLNPSISRSTTFMCGHEVYTAKRVRDFIFYMDPIFRVKNESTPQSGDAICKIGDIVKYAVLACRNQTGKIPLFILIDGLSIPGPTVINFNGEAYRFDVFDAGQSQLFGSLISPSEDVYFHPAAVCIGNTLPDSSPFQYILILPNDPSQIRLVRIPMLLEWVD